MVKIVLLYRAFCANVSWQKSKYFIRAKSFGPHNDQEMAKLPTLPVTLLFMLAPVYRMSCCFGTGVLDLTPCLSGPDLTWHRRRFQTCLSVWTAWRRKIWSCARRTRCSASTSKTWCRHLPSSSPRPRPRSRRSEMSDREAPSFNSGPAFSAGAVGVSLQLS